MSKSTNPSSRLGLPEDYFKQVKDQCIVKAAFQPEFSAENFIEKLSSVDIEFAKMNKNFEPKPFVRTFERTLESLTSYQSELGTTISRLENSTRMFENDHRKKMARLKRTFVTVGASFERLETQISEVGSNTIRIGEQLDTVAKEKDRAEAIRELVGFYVELNEGNTSHLDELLDGGPDGMMKVAHTLRRLNTIVADNEYSGPNTSMAKRHIEKYSESFEKNLLENFEAAYKDSDIQKMSISARTLDAFNGGVSVVKAYINQHPFFLSSMVNDSQASIAEASYQSMEGISDVNKQPPPPDRWLVQLYNDTRDMMYKDWSVISKVFPRPVDVMQQLLKRVFEQTIQGYLEILLERASRQSKLAFLRVLSSSHSATRKLIEDLQTFDSETITPAVTVLESARRSGNTAPNLLDPSQESESTAAQFTSGKYRKNSTIASRAQQGSSMDDDEDPDDEGEAAARLGAAKSGLNSAMAIAALIGRHENDGMSVGLLYGFLNRCCDDLFEAHIAGGNYISTECAHLREAFHQVLLPFARARSERHTSSRGNAFLGIFSSVTASSSAGQNNNGSGPGNGGNNNGNAGSGGALTKADQQMEYTGTIMTEVASTLLMIHSEAIARGVELENNNTIPEAMATLFGILISMIGDEYVFLALEDVMENLQDLRQEPDLRTFGLIRTANYIVKLVQLHFQRVVMPFVGTGSYIYRDMVQEKNVFMSRTESSLNLIANKMVGACVQWLATMLNKQRRGDFKPSDDGFTALEMGTQPCSQCTDFLLRVERSCTKSMDSDNRTRVLTDIGTAMYRMLMEHFKKFVVSVSGGLVVVKDMSKYREAIDAFGIPALSEKLATLQDISNIFLVQPSALKSLLDEGPLARLDQATIQSFVQMREDYRTSGLVRQLAG